MKIVEVSWLDAGCETMHMSLEEAKSLTPMPRTNIGYLVEENKDKIVLCFGNIRDREKHGEAWDTALVIPRGIVTEIRQLKYK